MVCTVTVWFHPARSIGSMHEATILAVIGLLYSAFISFTSMGISMFFGERGLLVVGHVIVLVLFVGGGTSISYPDAPDLKHLLGKWRASWPLTNSIFQALDSSHG